MIRGSLRSIADVPDLLHFKRIARTGMAFRFQPIAPIVKGGGGSPTKQRTRA
jgi:hypothetical protein